MQFAVLSPCLLQVNTELTQEEKFLHYDKLSDLLNKLNFFTNLKFQYYKKSPYEGYKMEIPDYHNLFLNNLVATNIYAVIQKMLIPEYVDLEGISPVKPPINFLLPENDLSDAFCSYINYLCGKDALLFISEDNFNLTRPIEFYLENTIKINTSTYINIELTDILLSYLKITTNNDQIFPRADFCSDYNNYVMNRVNNERMTQPEKIALFEKIGAIVATYNEYKKDQRLTTLNSTKKKLRTVYKKEFGKVFYLSIDVESGGFEVFDCRFVHLGQYNFCCNLVKPASPITHILYH